MSGTSLALIGSASSSPSATACTIDANGIHAPTFADVYNYLIGQYQAIYGSDVYLGLDSQDGQWIAVIAAAVNDANAAAIAVYNAFSPNTAQGVGLSNMVKINGISRAVATFSTVDLTVIGTPGTTILNGQVKDTNNHIWNLPSIVTIPSDSINGQFVVTATAAVMGNVTAAAGTVNKPVNNQAGWQAVFNVNAATPGAPVESDATLRRRQTLSTMQAAQTPLEALQGNIEAVTGVTRLTLYENSTDITDANGIPSHSIAVVVEGGDSATIGQAIAATKTIGAGTFGTTQQTIADQFGVPHYYRFFRPTQAFISVNVSITPLAGYTTAVGIAIQQAITNVINTAEIGQLISISKLYLPANLVGDPASSATYNIKTLQIARQGGTFQASDIALAFNEVAITTTSQVSVVVG